MGAHDPLIARLWRRRRWRRHRPQPDAGVRHDTRRRETRAMKNALVIGGVTIGGRVLLAPMTGVSDLPYRRAASRLCAPYVATEIVACELLANGRPDVVRRAAVGKGLPLTVIQLVGRRADWMAKGAAMAEAA